VGKLGHYNSKILINQKIKLTNHILEKRNTTTQMFLAKNELHKLCVELHGLTQSLSIVCTFAVDARQFS